MQTIRKKMNRKFRDLRGELFPAGKNNDHRQESGGNAFQTRAVLTGADLFFPDPAIPESVKQALTEAISAGSSEHYATAEQKYELNELFAERITDKTGLPIDPARNVLVTPGSDAGLFYAMMPFIEDGDEVLVPDPSYPKNFVNPELLGGVTVPVPLYAEDRYQLRVEELRKRLSPKTKMMILCHPNNPTSTVYREEVLDDLSSFIIENDLILLCDQAFEDHIYDGISYVSPSTLPGMWERTVTVCSTSKGFGLSGFRIGYIYAQEEIMQALHGGAGNVLGAASTLSILGAAAALKDPDYLNNNFRQLESRRRMAYEILHTVPGIEMLMPESGMLSWINVKSLGSGEEVAAYLSKEAGIEVSAGEQYGAQGAGYLRVVTGCYRDEKTAELVWKRLGTALTKMAEEKKAQGL